MQVAPELSESLTIAAAEVEYDAAARLPALWARQLEQLARPHARRRRRPFVRRRLQPRSERSEHIEVDAARCLLVDP